MADGICGTRNQVGGQLMFLDFSSTTGTSFFVDSATGASTNTGRTPASPFATLAQAVAACTPSKGDRIYLMPGHAETISAAAGIAIGTAGITITGLGVGSNRPTFSWSATASTWTITAANVTIRNIRCTASIDEVVVLFSSSAAHLTLDAVDYFETPSCQAIKFLLTTAASTDLVVKNCKHVQQTQAASAQPWLTMTGADRYTVIDNDFRLKLNDSATSGVVVAVTTQSVNVVIARNIVHMTGYSASLLSAFLSTSGTTGMVCDNRIGTDVAANTTVNDMPGCYSFNNLVTNAIDKSGIIDPVADT